VRSGLHISHFNLTTHTCTVPRGVL